MNDEVELYILARYILVQQRLYGGSSPLILSNYFTQMKKKKNKIISTRITKKPKYIESTMCMYEELEIKIFGLGSRIGDAFS